MNEKMALNLITRLMGWDDGKATQEFNWLRLVSAVKYDGYADFRSGVRFLETFVTWLKQFDLADRLVAYEFVKSRLVYFSPAEMLQLVESFFPETVDAGLREAVATRLGIKDFEVWATREACAHYEIAKRKTLFVGMSDGSRIDLLRRANATTLSTEQIVPMMNIDTAKWADLAKNLTADLGKIEKNTGVNAGFRKFERVYLVDDFTASGTTFVRRMLDEGGNAVWKGKLYKFNDLINSARCTAIAQAKEFPLIESYDLRVHHYISSDQAHRALDKLIAEVQNKLPNRSFGSIAFSEGMRLPEDLKLLKPADTAMLAICDNYYDHDLFEKLEKHCLEANMTHIRYGYADCALPVVLDHNTPNNSLSILWASTDGAGSGHPMEPLFQRRDRHG